MGTPQSNGQQGAVALDEIQAAGQVIVRAKAALVETAAACAAEAAAGWSLSRIVCNASALVPKSEVGRIDPVRMTWGAGPPHWVDLGAGLCVAGLLLLKAVYAGLASIVADVLRRTRKRDNVHTVVLNLEERADFDSTALERLIELDGHLRLAGRRLLLSRVKEPIRQLSQRWCPDGAGGSDRLYRSVADAVNAGRASSSLARGC